MEDFKDALENAKENLDHSDRESCGRLVDSDLYYLRETVRYLIICMDQVSVKE